MVQLVLDEHDVLRYSYKDQHHTLAISDMTQARIDFRHNFRHPYLASLIVIILALFLTWWIKSIGIASLYLFTKQGGFVLTAAFVMLYLLWHLLNMQKIHWLVIRTNKGRKLELPLDGYAHQEASQLLGRIHFKLQLQS